MPASPEPFNPIVLASSSAARKQVLSKIKLNFTCVSPDIDETPRPNETPRELVERLSQTKAASVAQKYSSHLIIGSDQVAIHNGCIVGKPKDRKDAVEQLRSASDQTIELLTGIALLHSASGEMQVDVLPYFVKFRPLSLAAIEDYIDRDRPYDCGGSLRSEGLGVALLEEFRGSDPNILLGLPLIRLIDMLAKYGVHPLQA